MKRSISFNHRLTQIFTDNNKCHSNRRTLQSEIHQCEAVVSRDRGTAGGHSRLNGPLEGPNDVAVTPPNGYGLFDMADNVHEWCLDAYHQDFYSVSPDRNPCAFGGSRRAARGGSWRHQIVVTPCSARASLPPSFHYADFGFRWVADVP